MSARDELASYWCALYGAEAPEALVEVRYRLPNGRGMGQEFYGVRDSQRAADRILRLGRSTDTYLGVAPRTRRAGGRDAIERVHALWADCDTRDAFAALDRFAPAPPIVVRSGSGLHAYWPLWPPLAPGHAERANRRLAHKLRADPRATDAARILRPPGTFNHKLAEPRPVSIERLEIEVYEAATIVGELPDPPSPRQEPATPRETRPIDPDAADVLLTIEPRVYVAALTGQEVSREGKVRCPLHEDRTPSLHVYPEPERGWYCYGCEHGGTIYDLAAALWRIEPRGEGFHELRRRLAAELLGSDVAAARRDPSRPAESVASRGHAGASAVAGGDPSRGPAAEASLRTGATRRAEGAT